MNLQKLRNQLADFGLNPADWVLELKRLVGAEAYFEVQSLSSELCFEGWAHRNRWRALRLNDRH